MARWILTGLVGAAASAASVFVDAGALRDLLLAVAGASAVLLAYWGARSDRRVEEAHQRILELSDDLVRTASLANTAHAIASRPIRDRGVEEDYANIVKPTEDAIAAVWARLTRWLRGSG